MKNKLKIIIPSIAAIYILIFIILVQLGGPTKIELELIGKTKFTTVISAPAGFISKETKKPTFLTSLYMPLYDFQSEVNVAFGRIFAGEETKETTRTKRSTE